MTIVRKERDDILTKAKLLIVEDESITAMDLRTRLTRLGYEVVGIATTGEDAVVMAQTAQPDLVLMDIRLDGDIDGIEAAKRIGANLAIPIIYLTAYADDATLARAKVTEPYGYILKPFEERELHTNISVALYKHEAEALRQREARSEVFSIMASALPVFANSVPLQARNSLLKAFAERFETNMRPRYQTYQKQIACLLDTEGKECALDTFFTWLDNLYQGFGTGARRSGDGGRPSVRLPQCHWVTEAKGNPIFCLMCRAMITRTFTWTGLGGSVSVVNTIANGAKECTFELALPRESK